MNARFQLRRYASVAILLAAVSLFGCSARNETLGRRLRTFAGPGALNCGDPLFDSLARKNNACAFGALSTGTAFYIRWQYQDGSTTRFRGIAMNSAGEMVMITPDPNPQSALRIDYCVKRRLVGDIDIKPEQVLTCN